MASRERLDPPIGSAPYARAWLLIEHPGPWRIDALSGSGIAHLVQRQLVEAVMASTARILLIRRPGRTPARRPGDDPPRHAWAVVRPLVGAVWGHWQADEDLLAAAAMLHAPVSGQEPVRNEPILLVCAHGIHDACCAIRGRPVAAALAEDWPEEVWECSHVGGDRFAPNVVVLPDGVYYGNLSVDTAVPTVRDHLAGRVPLDYLRGMARFRPPAQAAVAAVHQAYGPLGAHDVEVVSSVHPELGRWVVMARVPSAGIGELTVDVRADRRLPAQLTCRATRDTPAMAYVATLR